MTAALEGGDWSAACPGRTLPPGKTRYPLYRRLGIVDSGDTKEKRLSRHQCWRRTRQMVSGRLVPGIAR